MSRREIDRRMKRELRKVIEGYVILCNGNVPVGHIHTIVGDLYERLRELGDLGEECR